MSQRKEPQQNNSRSYRKLFLVLSISLIFASCATHQMPPPTPLSEDFNVDELRNQIITGLEGTIKQVGEPNSYRIEPYVVIEGFRYDQAQDLWFVGCAVHTLINGESDFSFTYSIAAAEPNQQAIISDIVAEWTEVFYVPLKRCLSSENPDIQIDNTGYYFGPLIVRGPPPSSFLKGGRTDVPASIIKAVNGLVKKTVIHREGELSKLSNIGSMNLIFLIDSDGEVVDGQFLWNGQLHPELRILINKVGWNVSSTGFVIKFFFFSDKSL